MLADQVFITVPGYRQRDVIEDMTLVRPRPICNGILVVLKRLGHVNGLLVVGADVRFARERWTEDRGKTSGVHGIASKSSQLIGEAKSSAAVSRRDIDVVP